MHARIGWWVLIVAAVSNLAATQDQRQSGQPPAPPAPPSVTQPPSPPPGVSPWPGVPSSLAPGAGYPGAPTSSFGPQAFSTPPVEIPMPEAPVFGFATGPLVRQGLDSVERPFLVIRDEPTGTEVTVLVDPQKTQMTREGRPAAVADYRVGDLVDVTYQWIVQEGQEDRNLALFIDTLDLTGGGDVPETPPTAETASGEAGP